MKGKLYLLVSIFVFLVCLSPPAGANDAKSHSAGADHILIVLKSESPGQMAVARKALQKAGVRIRSTYPPSVLIGSTSSQIIPGLAELPFVEVVSIGPLEPGSFLHRDDSVRDAVRSWNQRKAQPGRKPWTGPFDELPPFRDTVHPPSREGLSKAQRKQLDHDYLENRRSKSQKPAGDAAEGSPTDAVIETLSPDSSLSMAPGDEPALDFGTALGAGYTDTSLFMAGDVAVGFFFVPGDDGDWDKAAIDPAFDLNTAALEQFIEDQPNAGLSFTFVKEVSKSGKPNAAPADLNAYVNDLRNLYQTDWAYAVLVRNGPGRAYATLGGPSTTIFSADFRGGAALRHETMHIFNALDQYCPDACRSPIEREGYLNVINANAQTNDGNGYFWGAGEGLPDIMISTYETIGPYSGGQIGWRDSDGDGILDPLDTVPETAVLGYTGTETFTFTGVATDRALASRNLFISDVTLNTLTAVEYRINGGPWIPAQPVDGIFDWGEEEFTFTTPPLPNGLYAIETRGTNSVGNREEALNPTDLVVTDSTVPDAPPLPGLTVSPTEGSSVSLFTFDASSSLDLEDGASSLEARWDFEDDGTWDTPFAPSLETTRSGLAPGSYTVRVELRDRLGAIQSTARDYSVSASNLPPQARFTVTPENQHGPSETLVIQLDAGTVSDAEDLAGELQVRWDFDDDGTWDTPYAAEKALAHAYALPKGLALPDSIVDTPGEARKIEVVGSYAYVAGGSGGLQVLHIEDRANPSVVGSLALTGSAYDLQAVGNHLFVASSGGGFQIIDITFPATPTLVNVLSPPSSPLSLNVAGNYAYLAAGSSGLQVVDVSTPSSPVLIGAAATPGYASGVAVSGNFAYVADNFGGVQVFNVTNPAQPLLVASYATGGTALEVKVVNNLLYVSAYDAGLQILDITDPANPAPFGALDTTETIRSLAISGDYGYLAASDWGVLAVDLSDPAQPTTIGTYQNSGLAIHVAVDGSTLFLADYQDGVRLADLTLPLPLTSLDRTFSHTVRMEVRDSAGQTAQATRDIWAVSYNNPPQNDLLDVSEKEVMFTELAGTYNTPGTAYGVDLSGNLAYVADGTGGLQILDTSNPSQLALVGQIPTSTPAHDVQVSGSLAYLAADAGGLLVMDVSDPTQPAQVAFADTPGSAEGIHVVGNFAYVADAMEGLQIIDISDPFSPVLVGGVDTPAYTLSVFVSGTYAYVSDFGGGIQIVDVTDPAAPFIAANYATPSYADELVISDGLAYVAERYDGLEILDLSDPLQPVSLGSFDTLGAAIGVDVADGFAYVADYGQGLQIIDVTDPGNPVLKGSLFLPNYARNARANGQSVYVANDEVGLLSVISRPGIELTATAYVNDPDQFTTWDGTLEYRWDFDADGIWDTLFSGTAEALITLQGDEQAPISIVCEASDRFNAATTLAAEYQPPPPVNTPPVAMANGPYTGSIQAPVLLSGAGSYDMDGDPLTYLWDFGDGATATEQDPSHSYTAAGVYTVVLTVTDPTGASAADTTSVAIDEGSVNVPPVADAGSDRTVLVRQETTFDGSASYDPDGTLVSFQWDFGDGAADTGATVVNKYKKTGTYTLTLTVTDDANEQAQNSAVITVVK